jgi:hypothetical protein
MEINSHGNKRKTVNREWEGKNMKYKTRENMKDILEYKEKLTNKMTRN